MPTPRQMRKFVNQIVNQKIEEYPTTATIAEVNGNTCDVRLPGRSTHHKNCHVIGDPNSLFAGLHVNLLWDNYNGTKRPIVLAPGGGGVSGENRMVISTTSGTSTDVDDVTIENSPQGIRVKIGGITQEHLSFIPALIDHEHAVGEIIPGWNITDDGILYADQVSINPLGTITWGRDPDIVKIGVEDSTYRIFAGSSVGSAAPFSVSKTGQLISSSAIIAGWTISNTQIYKTGIVLDSAADAIYVGASDEIELDGATGRINVGASGDQIIIDGVNKYIKNTGYTKGSSGFIIQADGYAEFQDVRVRGSIHSAVFEYGDIQATAGTMMISQSAAKLYSDYTTPGSPGSSAAISVEDDNAGNELFSITTGKIATISINSGGSSYEVGDILGVVKSGGSGGYVEVAQVSAGVITEILMNNRGSGYTTGAATSTGGSGTGATFTINSIKTEGDILWLKTLTPTGVSEAWLEIGGKSSQSGYTIYTPAYLRSGDTSTVFEKGTGIVSLGQHNTGMIYLSADDVIGSSANISFIEWYRNAVKTVSVTAAGTGYDVGDILRLQDTNSFFPCRVRVTALVGTTTAVSTVEIYGSEYGSDYTTGTKTTVCEVGSGTGCTINITALMNPWDGSQLTFGRLGNIAGAYGAPSEDRYGFGFGDYLGGNYVSFNAETKGQFVVSSADGYVKLDDQGISINADPTYQTYTKLKWMDGSNAVAWMGSYYTSLLPATVLKIYNDGNVVDADTYLSLETQAASPRNAQATLKASNTAGPASEIILFASPTAESITYNSDSHYFQGGTVQITGASTPSIGEGLELSAYPSSNYALIQSYDRFSTAYRTLRLDGSTLQFYESGSPKFRVEASNLQKYFDGGWELTHQQYFDTPNQLWNGVARSSSSGTLTEAALGIPENCIAVYIRIAARDSGTFPVDTYLAFGRAAADYQVACYPPGSGTGVTNGVFSGSTGWAQLSGGTLNWQTVASGSGTMDTWLWVLGYAM